LQCAKAGIKADAPVDSKDKYFYSFGSLLDGKNDLLKKIGHRRDSSESGSDDSLKEVRSTETEEISKNNRIWKAICETLKDIPLDFIDKKTWTIKTSKVTVEQFDNTGKCYYVIEAKMTESGELVIKITSDEDSALRVDEHQKTLKAKIIARANDLSKQK
jgi:hypothetical protein